MDSSPFPALFSICVRCFIYGADICSIVVSTSSQAKKIYEVADRRMDDRFAAWLTKPELWNLSTVCNSRKKHTDQIHHGAADVFVLLGFFRCVSTFRFSCVFLTENLLAMNFRRSNISYIGGVAASRFSDIPYSAPSASKPPLKMKKLPGEKAQICYAGCPYFLNTFFLHFRKTYATSQSWFHQNHRF